MIKYLFNKIYFIIKYIIFLILIFVIIESLSRGFIWIVTKDFKAFLYGFNKDIKVNIFHLRKFDIKLTDLYSVNQVTLNNKLIQKKETEESIKIWAFGGSTTKGNVCGKNSSNWTTEMNKINNNIKINNFSQNGIDSEKSLYYLRKNILKEKVPKIVIWAHKVNEINIIYQGLKPNNEATKYFISNQRERKFKYTVQKLDVTLKSNFLSYKILENFILSLTRKLIRSFGKEHINKNLTYEDFQYASINYKINVSKAIKLSKENGVEKFILLSLPARSDYEEKMKNLFFLHYYERVKELVKDNYVNFIDISNHPKFTNDKNLFCDEVHKTLLGNVAIAEILNEYLVKN